MKPPDHDEVSVGLDDAKWANTQQACVGVYCLRTQNGVITCCCVRAGLGFDMLVRGTQRQGAYENKGKTRRINMSSKLRFRNLICFSFPLWGSFATIQP